MKPTVKWRYAVSAAVLTGAVASAAFAGVLRSGESDVVRPTLTLAGEAPVILAGRGFVPGEHVAVKVYGMGGPRSKSVTAGRHGRFAVRFLRADAACAPLRATAIGTKGSRASLRRHTIPPPCGVPIQP
jgi:hypothetical protein